MAIGHKGKRGVGKSDINHLNYFAFSNASLLTGLLPVYVGLFQFFITR